MNSENGNETAQAVGVPAEDGSDVIETQRIVNITPQYDDDGRAIRYSVLTEQATHQISYLGNQPERLIVVNDHPLVTCSRHYEPISHQKLLRMFKTALGGYFPNVEAGNYFGELEHLPSTFYRMAKSISLGEQQYSGAGKLTFGMLITNSYDLSLGIHVDGFLFNKEDQTTIFLGLAGSWKNFLKHYHDDDKIAEKLDEKVKFIADGMDERAKLITEFANRFITPEEFTEFARSLWVKKNEVDILKAYLPDSVDCSWVTNFGFTCVDITEPLTSWDVVKIFSKWASKQSEDRHLDVAMRIYGLMALVMED